MGVLVLYLVGVVGLGCWFARKSSTTDEFMAAGRSLPGWAVGLSILGTYVSSISFLANPGKSFGGDWNPFVFALSLPLAAVIAVRWFVPFYRRHGHLSAYEHLETRFGPWARAYAGICYLLTQIARMGTIMYLVALALAPLTGWGLVTIILVTGGLVTLYTLVGGIEAVIWTDVMQSIVLIAGMLVCVVVLLGRMPEGAGQVFQIAAQHDKFSLGSFGASLTESTFWVVLIYGVFVNLQNFGIDQSYVQRYATAKDERAAVNSVWLGALGFLPVAAVLFFIGTALFAFYTAHPGLLPADLKADAVFPHFIATQLPTGIRGLLIAAVLAAAMSSVDSSLNCAATLTLCDFWKRHLNPRIDEAGSMKVLRVATIGWGVLGTGMAIAMIQVKSALDAWWQLAGIASGGMLGLFLLGLLSRTARNPAAITGVVLGVLVIVWMSLSPGDLWPAGLAGLKSPFHGFLTIVFGTTTILVAGLVLAGLAGRNPAVRPEADQPPAA